MGLGAWRFIFAIIVVLSHLWGDMIQGPAAYSVWGFFLISGYLMTLGVLSRYSDGLSGLKDYAFNRFLRIYPSYYIACVLGLLALVVLPRYGVFPSSLNPQFLIPVDWKDWLTNAFLVPLFGGGRLLVPVSGALGVEVGVYLLIPLLARGPAVAWLGLILSGLLNLKYGIQIQDFPLRYASFLTSFMAFSIGSLVAHYRGCFKKLRAPFLSSCVWFMHSLVWLVFDQWPWTWGLYFSLLLSAWLLVSFVDREVGIIDRWLGDLSYPIYLLHTAIAVWWFGLFDMNRSLEFCLLGCLCTLVVSWVIVTFVDRPLEKRFKRRRVRL